MEDTTANVFGSQDAIATAANNADMEPPAWVDEPIPDEDGGMVGQEEGAEIFGSQPPVEQTPMEDDADELKALVRKLFAAPAPVGKNAHPLVRLVTATGFDRTVSNGDMRTLTQSYAIHGLPLHPCTARRDDTKGKTPLTAWRESATSDEVQVKKWWDKWPKAVPAMPTGGTDSYNGVQTMTGNVVVWDIDRPDLVEVKDKETGEVLRRYWSADGLATLKQWVQEHGKMPATLVVMTPGNVVEGRRLHGLHIYFALTPATATLKNSVGKDLASSLPGTDVRATGGYIMAPGGTRLDGGQYVPLLVADIAEMPDDLCKALPHRGESRAQSAVAKPTISSPALMRPAASGQLPDSVTDLPAGCQTAVGAGGKQYIIGPGRDTAWGMDILTKACADIEGTPEGARNDTANCRILHIGNLVAGGWLSYQTAIDRLWRSVSSTVGGGEVEARQLLRQDTWNKASMEGYGPRPDDKGVSIWCREMGVAVPGADDGRSQPPVAGRLEWNALGDLKTSEDADRAMKAVRAAIRARTDGMTATVKSLRTTRTWSLSRITEWRNTNAGIAEIFLDLFGAAAGRDDKGQPRQDNSGQEVLIDRNSKNGTVYLWTGHFWQRDDHDRRNLFASPVRDLCRSFAGMCAQIAKEITAVKDRLLGAASGPAKDEIEKGMEKLEAYWRKDMGGMLRDISRSVEHTHVLNQSLYWAMRGPDYLGDSGMHWDAADAVRNRLPTPSGVLCLDTMSMRNGMPSDRYLMHTAVDYNPDARGDRWRKFVLEIMGGDSELADYLQTLVGAALCRDTQADVFAVLYGGGANGKSLFKRVLTAALGDELSQDVPSSLIIQGKGEAANAPNAALIALRGRAIVWMEELKAGDCLDTGRMKQISQGTRITARAPYETEQVSFEATAIPFLLTNEKPRVNARDLGTWRRLILIPMDQTFLKPSVMKLKGIDPNALPPGIHLADPALGGKLMEPAELQGVLTWAVEGAIRYQQQGMPDAPKAVAAATLGWARESDTLSDFISECLDLVPDAETPTADLWQIYQMWARQNGVRHMLTKTGLTRALLERRDSVGLPLFTQRLIGKSRSRGLRGCGIDQQSDAAIAVRDAATWDDPDAFRGR